jgi:PTS system fructose-specific IIC component
VNISRFLNTDLIKLQLQTEVAIDPEEPLNPEKWARVTKEKLLWELVELLERSGNVKNRKRLFSDLYNREKKASTGIGHGIALPHVRTMQVSDFVLGFARSREGYEFGSLDGGLVHLFFVMAAPPYDDQLYLRVFKSLAELLHFDHFRRRLLEVSTEYEVIKAFKEME